MSDELQQVNIFSSPQKELLNSKDKELLNLRKRIRNVAQSKNLKIDETQHYNSDNLGLKKFLESCNIDFNEFVKEYLLNLQPFMIHLDKDRSSKASDFACIVDPAYRLPLWVEFYYTQFHEYIISFHE